MDIGQGSVHTGLVAEFDEKVRTICLTCEGSVISGYRTEDHNEAVGGHISSLHKAFLAKDLKFDTVVGKNRAKDECRRLELFWKENGTHTLHIQALRPIT